MNKLTIVRLDHPLFRTTLAIARVPKFLRFACNGLGLGTSSRQWDALDQLDDEPLEGEALIAGVLKSRGSLHVDGTRNGKRFGEWYATADYALVTEQPTQEVMLDGERWRKWCEAQAVDGVRVEG